MFELSCSYADRSRSTTVISKSKTESAEHAAWRLFFANTTYPTNESTVLKFRGNIVARWNRSENDSIVHGFSGPRASLLEPAASLPAYARPTRRYLDRVAH